MPSNHLILCHPLLLLPSIFPSIRVFSNKSVLHIRWPKHWSFSFSISPSLEGLEGLVGSPCRMDWLDLLAVQGPFKSRWDGLVGSPLGDGLVGSPCRMDWLDLLAIQGTVKSLLQHHSSKASVLRCSAFFMVQLSHPYMTSGKTIALTRRTVVMGGCFYLYSHKEIWGGRLELRALAI